MGIKEKLFRLNLRCTGKTGQVWKKGKFRKLPGVTKLRGSHKNHVYWAFSILPKSRFQVHYNLKKKKGNIDFKTNLPLADFALSRHGAPLDLVMALEPRGGQFTSKPGPFTSSVTSQVCWVDFLRQLKTPLTEPSILNL